MVTNDKLLYSNRIWKSIITLGNHLSYLQGDTAMQQILIYSTRNCPNCRVLKQYLETKDIKYKEMDMATPAALTELRMNGVFTMAAPVLQIGDKFYTTRDMFKQDGIDQSRLETLLKA